MSASKSVGKRDHSPVGELEGSAPSNRRDILSVYGDALLETRYRDELRLVLRVFGYSLLAAGLLCTGAAILAQLAWALPLTGLIARGKLIPALICFLVGGIALGAARRLREWNRRQAMLTSSYREFLVGMRPLGSTLPHYERAHRKP
jgi:hypothetical protein